MIKEAVRFVLLSALLAGCAAEKQQEAAPVPSGPATTAAAAATPAREPDKRVCCESFGYGAMMVECCSEFARVKVEECKIPPGFVGGNKRVVADEKCPPR